MFLSSGENSATGKMTNSSLVKLMEVEQMRLYDELWDLDIKETPESLR